ncbi:hypothetical protein B0O80DRAFT_461435, partial [Mortierella sp. GBAus27b]
VTSRPAIGSGTGSAALLVPPPGGVMDVIIDNAAEPPVVWVEVDRTTSKITPG